MSLNLGSIGQAAGVAILGNILSAISPGAGPTAGGVTPPPPAGQPPSPDGMIFGIPIKTAVLVGAAGVGILFLLTR